MTRTKLSKVTESQAERGKTATGEVCGKHSGASSYVDAEDRRRCLQCDREAEEAKVEKLAREAKERHEREEAAKAVPFSFITDEKLRAAAFAGTAKGAADKLTETTALESTIRHWEASRVAWYAKNTSSPCTTPIRWKLPNERKSLTHHFEIGDENKDGVSAYITVGLFDDFRIGEVFIKAAKMGGYISGFTDAFATSLSILFQHGVPLKVFVEKFSFQSFDPSGFVRGGPDQIKMCKSVLDYIVRWLALRFPDGYLDQELRPQAVVTKAS